MSSDSDSHERPLIQQRIVLVPIDKLHGHEQTVRSQIDWLKDNITSLGYFFRPILIAKGDNVILDGHHRVEALKELGGIKIPCIEIDYLNNDQIKLDTWHPMYHGTLGDKTIQEILEKMGIKYVELEKFEEEQITKSEYGFILKTNTSQFGLVGTQQELYSKFLERFDGKDFEYSKTIDFAINMVMNGRAKFVLLRRHVTKRDVLETAKSGHPFAPKTTRHILSFRYQDIKVPLKALY
ncbi:MAG: hypothetical protein ACTSW1_18590 [Candidatus Hodarchaeales archaeon]